MTFVLPELLKKRLSGLMSLNSEQIKDVIEQKINNMTECVKCGNISVIQVAISDGIPFYSCITEGCVNEAQLLVDIGDAELIRYDKLYETFRKIVKHGNSKEDNDQEGEG